MSNRDAIGELARRVRKAQRVAVLTGAGVSAASGVPTFRGSQGLWQRYSPEELATPQAFEYFKIPRRSTSAQSQLF